MRFRPRSRWAAFALATTLCVPALADSPRTRSLSDCALFDQTNKDDATVELSIRNTCTVPIDCSISWRVVCAPQSHERRVVHDGSTKQKLAEGATLSTDASAKPCGDDPWTIDHVEWSCMPNKE